VARVPRGAAQADDLADVGQAWAVGDDADRRGARGALDALEVAAGGSSAPTSCGSSSATT
jgi:hypothetical protein